MAEKKYSLHDNENIERAKTDREYLGELIIHNEDLIWFSIRNYVGDPVKLAKYNGMEKDDIQQIGRIGFIKAVDNFDCTKGVLFTTYAPAIIAGEVKDYIRTKGRLIKLPRSAHDLNIKIMDYTENIYYDKFIPVQKVAEEIEEDIDKVQKILTVGSLPEFIPFCKKNKYENNEIPNYKYELKDVNINVEEEIVEKIYLDQLLEAVKSQLNDRDKRIFKAKLNGETHEEIAKKEDISKITITRTMNKVRKILKEIKD